MEIKIHTLIKGLVWESIGVLILFGYTWFATGDVGQAIGIGFGYPLLRTILWYPFERLFKRVRRWRFGNVLVAHREKVIETHGMKQPILIGCKAPPLTISQELIAQAAANDKMRKAIHDGVDAYIDSRNLN